MPVSVIAVDGLKVSLLYAKRMSKSIDRLTLLETFARIAERGSISAAARDLGMSQASASRQLKELETRLGAHLVRRTTHSLLLTQAGQACLADARGLLQSWEAMQERHMGDPSVLTGKLKVVAPVGLGQRHLSGALVKFHDAHPGVDVTWHLQDDTLNFIESGCDLWMKIGPVPDDRLIARGLGKVERLVVAAPHLVAGEPTPKAVATGPWIALSPFEANHIPLANTRGRQTTIDTHPTLTTNNLFAAYEAAKKGVGFAVMPRWFVEEDLNTGTLIDNLPAWRAAPRTLYAAYLPHDRQSLRLQAMIDHMETAVAKTAGILPI